jgi:hypothetical protein
MNDYPLTRLWMASVDLWASSWQIRNRCHDTEFPTEERGD